MQRFDQKIILVTGGDSGIGLAVAKRLVSESAKVLIAGRDPVKINRAVAELGQKAAGIVVDVSQVADISSLFAGMKKYGPLYGLFANAGISLDESLEDMTEEKLDSILAVNFKGTFFTLQKAVPHLAEGASVVITASVSDTKGSKDMIVYPATKAAIRSMARTFSSQLLSKKIRVNAVSPGAIETPIWEGVSDAEKEARAKKIPLQRFGTPDEVANAVVFLLSDESSYILGAELYVDGGSGQL